jgi:putative transposase
MQDNKWARLLAYVTGVVNQRLLLQCENFAAENRIIALAPSNTPAALGSGEIHLAEIGKRLGRKHLAEVACVLV